MFFPLPPRLVGGSSSPDPPEVSSSESGSESDLDAGSTSQEGSIAPPPDPGTYQYDGHLSVDHAHSLLSNKVCDPAAEQSQPLRWESRDWSRQRGEVTTHLCGEGLQPDSLARRFSFEEKSSLLSWSGLPSSHWTPDPQPGQTAPPGPRTPGARPGYYHTTILGQTNTLGTWGHVLIFFGL